MSMSRFMTEYMSEWDIQVNELVSVDVLVKEEMFLFVTVLSWAVNALYTDKLCVGNLQFWFLVTGFRVVPWPTCWQWHQGLVLIIKIIISHIKNWSHPPVLYIPRALFVRRKSSSALSPVSCICVALYPHTALYSFTVWFLRTGIALLVPCFYVHSHGSNWNGKDKWVWLQYELVKLHHGIVIL
jgi:hypothetical protein